MAIIMVSMEVLHKSTGQWCPCRCGEGNDIDIGVLGILQDKYKSMHIGDWMNMDNNVIKSIDHKIE